MNANENELQHINYFKKPSYNGFSIVDGLKSIGEESSFDYRVKIASINGIQNYDAINNINENLYMLNLLKHGKLKKP